jgi:CRISPR-associated endonuclease/helicase Cas3
MESTTRASEERELVLVWLDEHGNGPMAHAAAELLRSSVRQVDLVVLHDGGGIPARVLVIDGRRAVADEYVRQEWTPSDHPVRLDDHQTAVAERVTELARHLRVADELVSAMREAALHHDDGKADPRFQVRLGARGSMLLAKSHGLATPETVRRRSDRSGLPPQWRHEQRSVVDAWASIPADVDRDLVARLIGTTHGHGRSCFPHTSAELLGDTDDPAARDIAAMLFDEGGWDQLMERTQHRYGVWACAYLEAVLRGADGQVSAEKR